MTKGNALEFWSNFWDIIWWFLWAFVFITYLFALFSIINDLFRDHKLSGWAKAAWLICLLFLPFLTALVYLVARGDGMAKRSRRQARDSQEATEEYIRSVASSPASEIAKAKDLLDSGAITSEEFDAIKAHVLSGQLAR